MNGYYYEYNLDRGNYLIKKGFKVVGSGYGKKDKMGYLCFKHCGQLSLEVDSYNNKLA